MVALTLGPVGIDFSDELSSRKVSSDQVRSIRIGFPQADHCQTGHMTFHHVHRSVHTRREDGNIQNTNISEENLSGHLRVLPSVITNKYTSLAEDSHKNEIYTYMQKLHKHCISIELLILQHYYPENNVSTLQPFQFPLLFISLDSCFFSASVEGFLTWTFSVVSYSEISMCFIIKKLTYLFTTFSKSFTFTNLPNEQKEK